MCTHSCCLRLVPPCHFASYPDFSEALTVCLDHSTQETPKRLNLSHEQDKDGWMERPAPAQDMSEVPAPGVDLGCKSEFAAHGAVTVVPCCGPPAIWSHASEILSLSIFRDIPQRLRV